MKTGFVNHVPGAIMLKDIDAAKGRIQGYFAVFGNIDSDGDMIMPGAFKRSIDNNGARIKHLWQHDVRQPLAVPDVSEDSYGLFFDSTISKTSLGRDVIQLYIDGVIDEHSIGYQVVRSSNKSGYKELLELKLFEGSSVTFAANELARVTSVKGLTADEINSRMHTVEKAMRNGRYENESIYEALDVQYKGWKNLRSEMGVDEHGFTKEEQQKILNALAKAHRDMDRQLSAYENTMMEVGMSKAEKQRILDALKKCQS